MDVIRIRKSIMNFYDQFERMSPVYTWVVLIVYIAGLVAVTSFHEPWYDEAQSWLIARDAGIRDIIFSIPHYEGHPPIWHLYLALFAKTGVPYLFGLKAAAIIPMAIAMGLLLFKAPFPKLYRFLIPFSFYFFFQYGVVSRCYSLLVLGFVLAAMTWSKRDIHPYRFVFSLILLCSSTAYGIVLAAGITLVWLIDILRKGSLPRSWTEWKGDRRVHALMILLMFALAMVFLMIPAQDAYAVNLPESTPSIFERIFFVAAIVPMESMFFRSIPGNYALYRVNLEPAYMVVSGMISLIVASIIGLYAYRKKHLLLILLPYVLFTAFGVSVYLYSHHYGIITAFLLFCVWAMSSSKECRANSQHAKGKIGFHALMVMSLVVSVYWTVMSIDIERRTNYNASKDIAQYIQDNGLENERIMMAWDVPGAEEKHRIPNPDHQAAPCVNAYFDNNVIANFNYGHPDMGYESHRVYNGDEVAAIYHKWAMEGAPDVLIGRPKLSDVFDDKVTYDHYVLTATFTEAQVVKDYEYPNPTIWAIYVRKERLEAFHLEAIPDVDWTQYINGDDYTTIY